jgi:hypothetical protein
MEGTLPPEGATYQTARLGVGRHDGPGAVVCIMELASMLAGERFSDHPVSVCPIVGAILRAYNDDIDQGRRPDLYRYAAESVGTRGSYALQLRRARHAIAWARTVYSKRGRLRRRPTEPRPDHGPDEIAFYLVRSLGRRHSDESHAAVLAMLDELIELGLESRMDALPELPAESDAHAPAEPLPPLPELTGVNS